ncbi:MAG TPA: hypothetical protein PKD92_02905 [Novosphingobium sp.]|mgnify:CR=1 FL=1|nr:hypothetical protein [Novosphingobium sp.]
MDETNTFTAPPPRRNGSARLILAVAVLAFVGGLVLAGWLVWRGEFRHLVPSPAERAAPLPAAALPPLPRASASPVPRAEVPLESVEARVALLEARLSRIDSRADAAAGNAARAEALLIAMAARRMVERGQPLGFLEGQLKVRFGDAQPNAVQTLVLASQNPVTLDQLIARLDAARARLTADKAEADAWTHIRHEVSSLFVIYRETDRAPALAPAARLERARLLLAGGRVNEAIAEIERLPGAREGSDWIEQARRYDAAQRALDLIETTAMLEPIRLGDGEGRKVVQPSPLASPVPSALPSPVASPAPAAPAS